MNSSRILRVAITPALFVLIAICFACSVWLFYGFTAEDAYIVYRYSEHFFHLGALIYNEGERVNALTSPLHALLVSLLYGLRGESVASNKLVSLVMLLITAAAVGYRYRQQPLLAALSLSLILLPPWVVLWTFGGLETPLLMLLLTVLSLAALEQGALRPWRLHLLALACGLAFLTRYDAGLYVVPLALALGLREPCWRQRLLVLCSALILPLAWLVLAYSYYGDIFPNSFYVKTPHAGWRWMAHNGKYIFLGLTLTGLLPACLLWYAAAANRPLRERLRHSLRALWPLYLGLTLELGYGLTMATTHMMFSFRALVPYLPAGALLILESIRLEQQQSGCTDPDPRWQWLTAAFVVALCGGQTANAWASYTRSLNPFNRDEFHSIGSRDFMGIFMHSLWQQAKVIQGDWASRPESAQREARLFTYAGGVVPYALPDAYVYEALASWRYGAPPYGNWARYADYAMVVAPFFGSPEQQLPGVERAELIFEEQFVLHDQLQSFRVYHNPHPLPQALGSRIDQCCIDAPRQRK